MQIAARTAAWAKSGGWVNPYVTDGLVAMWDGEWNAGGGIHDPNATVWKDLIGSCDFALNSFWSFGEKSIVFAPASISGSASIITTSAIPEGLGTSQMTLEIVFDGRDAVGYAERAKLFGNTTNSDGAYFVGDSLLWDRWNGTLININNIGLEKSSPFLYSFSIANGVGKYYANSNFFKQSLSVIPNVAGYSVGSSLGAKTQGEKLKWNSIRIYNVELTGDQIVANYAIDKARFGLT